MVLTGVGASGWFGYQAAFGRDSGIQFRTAEVMRGSIVSTVSATGTVEPLVKVLVGTEVSGTVRRWNADFNQTVSAGFVLAELDPDRFQRTLDQRVAAVSVSRANLEQARVRAADAQRNLDRLERLYKTSDASDDELLNQRAITAELKAAVLAAEAAVASAEAEQKAADVDLSKTVIRAPIEGVVISRDIDVGQTVAASLQTPNLFTIAADLRRMQVHANVSETDIGRVHDGMQAEFTVDAYPGRKFVGEVSQVRFNPTIVDNVVSYITLIDVENNDLALRPGMTATIAFEVARAESVLTVPTAALRFQPESPGGPASSQLAQETKNDGTKKAPTIYRLDKGRPVPVAVTVGLSDGTRTQIDGGSIAEGTPIVIERILPFGRGAGGPTARPMRPL